MIRFNVEVKGYGFLPFAQNMGKNMGKNMSKKYSQKFVDHTKQSATDAHKTVSKRAIQKLSWFADMIGNKVNDKITKTSKTSQQKNSETVTNEHDK